MRKLIVPALTFLLGVTVAVVIYRSAFAGRPAAPHGSGILGALTRWLPAGEPDARREPHAKAARLLQAGQLREAQDAFLQILSANPRDEEALRGLVSVRRVMAGDNPAVLRRQAAEYWEAIRRGASTAEHYSPGAMEALLAATLQAVQEIEAHGKPASPAPQVAAQAATPPAPQPRDAAPLSGTPPLPAARPSGPSAPAVSAPSEARPPVPAPPALKPAPAVRAVAAPPALPSARRGPAPATPQPKPAAPPAAASVAKPSTPSPSTARATAPSVAIPSSAPAQKESEKPSARPARTAPPVAGSGATPLPAAPAPQGSAASAIPSRQTAPPAAAPTLQPSPPAAEPTASAGSRLYTVRVGPLADRSLASAIATQLSAGGFSPNISSRSGYRVVSEPLPRNAAEGLAASLAGRGIRTQVESLGRDTVQLVFGSFASQKEAEALSQRVSAQGYDAWVREGTVYTLQLGPYPQSSVNAISGIVRSNAPTAPVTADPVP